MSRPLRSLYIQVVSETIISLVRENNIEGTYKLFSRRGNIIFQGENLTTIHEGCIYIHEDAKAMKILLNPSMYSYTQLYRYSNHPIKFSPKELRLTEVEVIEIMLQFNANINIPNDVGRIALHNTHKNNIDLIDYLFGCLFDNEILK